MGQEDRDGRLSIRRQSRARSDAPELLGRLGPGKLATVVQWLEVIIHDDEPVNNEDRGRCQEGQDWFAQRGGKGIPMEDVLAGFGMKPEDFPLTKSKLQPADCTLVMHEIAASRIVRGWRA
jgi:hypothetical protein